MNKRKIVIPHHPSVELSKTIATFSKDGEHRHSLIIPFVDRKGKPLLGVIGQNPSDASHLVADKTIRFIEDYIHTNLTQYGGLIMLNLYSRVDTDKSKQDDPITPEAREAFIHSIKSHSDFLAVWGKAKREGIYDFKSRALEIINLFIHKHVFKFDIKSTYPPHPGNPKITYANMNIGLSEYDFSDLRSHRA